MKYLTFKFNVDANIVSTDMVFFDASDGTVAKGTGSSIVTLVQTPLVTPCTVKGQIVQG